MRPPVVIILGMHNSGTSLLARLAALLGLRLGEQVLTRADFEVAPAYDYWEHARITALQDELLSLLDRHWSQPSSHWPIPPALWDRPEVRRIERALRDVVAAELAQSDGAPWGFKDPRTVRLMPLWRRILTGLDVETRYLISLRDPATVTASFASKGQVAPADAEALWRRHYVEALAATQGQPRLVVDYDGWLERPELQIDALAGFLGASARGPQALEAVRAAIDPTLRTMRAQEFQLSPLTLQTAECLRAMVGGAEPAARIDALLAAAGAADRRPAA